MKNHQKPSCAGQKGIIQNDVDHFLSLSLSLSIAVCGSACALFGGGENVKIVSRVKFIETFMRWCWIL